MINCEGGATTRKTGIWLCLIPPIICQQKTKRQERTSKYHMANTNSGPSMIPTSQTITHTRLPTTLDMPTQPTIPHPPTTAHNPRIKQPSLYTPPIKPPHTHPTHSQAIIQIITRTLLHAVPFPHPSERMEKRPCPKAYSPKNDSTDAKTPYRCSSSR